MPRIKVGDIIDTEGEFYRVKMINESRAFCVPLNGNEAKGINIGPTTNFDEMVDPAILGLEGEQMAPSVDIPVAGKKTISKALGRRISKAAAKATKRGTLPGPAGRKVAKTQAKAKGTVKPCGCGCGNETKAYFMPGHDARWKGWLLKLERGTIKRAALPKTAQAAMAAYRWVKKGDGVIPTKNYKGEAHTGYAK